ncbi:MAG TPA: hypothetical protein VFA99_12920 [Acidobacteriaceae bacterium]|nr:hypothetical protein [Acidobacteriaceae bacterium]
MLLVLTLPGMWQWGVAQNTPLLSGGLGFFTSTNNGATSYLPIMEPLGAAPIGNHFLLESRATLLEDFTPKGGDQDGYNHSHYIALTYLQGDYFLAPHITIVGGSFLTPFATFNERLSPLWIDNFQDGPLIAGLGTMQTATSLGGQLRGSAISRSKYSIDYAAYFSARSGNQQFNSARSSGGRVNLYLPDQRLEIGTSYGRLLQGTHENFFGIHVWWEPKDTGFRLRSEWARGAHGNGYWVEAAYRMMQFGGYDSWVGRIEPLFRMQQTFNIGNTRGDPLPSVNTQRADFGLNYNLPHNTRIMTSYSRQSSSTHDANIWETGLTYRFLFPAWKGR